jgi:hypothetical protein
MSRLGGGREYTAPPPTSKAAWRENAKAATGAIPLRPEVLNFDWSPQYSSNDIAVAPVKSG